jgi:hypothetical protein
MRGLAIAVLVGGCAASQAENRQSHQTPLSHEARYTNGDIAMEADGSLLVSYDMYSGRPPRRVAPDQSGYQHYIELARGLSPGQRKRMYTSNGWYRRNEDGSFTTEGISNVGGVGVISRETIAPEHEHFNCMTALLGDAEINRMRAYLNYDRDRVWACVSRGPEPPAPEHSRAHH